MGKRIEAIKTFLYTGQRAERVTTRSTWDLIVPAWALTNETKFVTEAYRRNPVVFASIDYLTRAVSSAVLTGWRTKRDGSKEKLPPTHPLAVLLRRPDVAYKTQRRFIRQVIRRLCLSGECILYKIGGNANGSIAGLQMLPSRHIQVVPALDGTVARYDYRPDPMKDPIPLDPEDVIFLKFDDPLDDYRGLSPLMAAARETDIDNEIVNYRKGYFQNAAIPAGVLTTKMPARAEQLREWSKDFSERFGGAKKAGKTPALAGGLEYQKAGANPGEMEFSDVTALSEIRICMAFGVTPILINSKAGLDRSNYSNYREAKVVFWEDTAVPLMEFLEDDMTAGLTSLTDVFYCEFDRSGIPALQEDASKKQERQGRKFKDGIITLNEYRQSTGENPVEDGEVYYRPANVVPVPAGDLDKPPAPEENPNAEEEVEGEEDQAASGDDDNVVALPSAASASGPSVGREASGDARGAVRRFRRLPASDDPSEAAPAAVPAGNSPSGDQARAHGGSGHTASEGHPAHQRELSATEKDLRNIFLNKILGPQADALQRTIPEALEQNSDTEGAEENPLFVELIIQAAWNREVEVSKTADAMRNRLRRIVSQGLSDAERDLGVDQQDLDNEIDEYLDDATLRAASSITETTEGVIRDAITGGLDDGDSFEQIGNEVYSRVRDADRAELIAVDRSQRARNAGRLIVHRSEHRVSEWQAREDACEYCRALDGETVEPGENFVELNERVEGTSGGSFLVRYADVAHPPLHPLCRCDIVARSRQGVQNEG